MDIIEHIDSKISELEKEKHELEEKIKGAEFFIEQGKDAIKSMNGGLYELKGIIKFEKNKNKPEVDRTVEVMAEVAEAPVEAEYKAKPKRKSNK